MAARRGARGAGLPHAPAGELVSLRVGDVLGAVGGAVLSWALARHLFEIDWTPAPGLLVGGILLAAALVGVVGVVSSLDVLRRKPLTALRGE